MNAIKISKRDYPFYIVSFLFLGLNVVIILAPLMHIVSQAFSSPVAVISGRVYLFPVDFSLESFSYVLKTKQIWTGFLNSVINTVLGTSLNLVLTMICAYPLSRKQFYGRRFFTLLFAFTMLFSGGMIPSYLLVRDLNLIDTRWALILPVAMTVWNMILARTFLENSIPPEMYEACEIDGGSDYRIFVSIVLPLSKPILAVLTLFYMISHWNSYFNAMLYTRSPELITLQLVLRNVLTSTAMLSEASELDPTLENAAALLEALRYTLIVIAAVPLLCVYPFVQKYFVKGIMVGAIKG